MLSMYLKDTCSFYFSTPEKNEETDLSHISHKSHFSDRSYLVISLLNNLLCNLCQSPQLSTAPHSTNVSLQPRRPSCG